MISNQAYLFLIFTLNGIIIGLLFDFFRILRKSFKTADFVTYIQDVLFWILTGFVILYSIFTFNDGQIRFFMFLGIGIGVTLYMLTLSSYFIKINVFIINKLKHVIKVVFKILIYPIEMILKILRKIFLKPIAFLFINIKNITKKSAKFFYKSTSKIEKTLKDTKNLKNNTKKEGIYK